MMKKVIAMMLVLLVSSAYATTKCVPDGRGGLCCWDVDSQGPFKPINC